MGIRYAVTTGRETGATNEMSATECAERTMNGNYLCGYELGASFAFPPDWISLPDRDGSALAEGSFSGIFEGNGYELSNLDYESDNLGSVGGLFDALEAYSIIRNLRVSGRLRASASVGGVGSIAGHIEGSGALIAVSSAAIVSGQAIGVDIGGLVGILISESTIIYSSFAAGEVHISDADGDAPPLTEPIGLGGLVGYSIFPADPASIVNSYAGGAVAGDATKDAVGGLVGNVFSLLRVSKSYVSATVNGLDNVNGVGGLIGLGPPDDSGFVDSYYDEDKVTIGDDDVHNMFADSMGDMRPIGTPVTDAQLTGCTHGAAIDTASPPAGGCSSLYTGWDSAIWDFGTSTQLPALKYAQIPDVGGDECSSTAGVGAAELAANFRPNAIAQPYCGKLQLGQGR